MTTAASRGPTSDSSRQPPLRGRPLDLSADFSEGAVVLTGMPGSLTPVECYPHTPISFAVTSGETYLIVAIDLQQDEGGNGGLLSLSVDVSGPPPLPPPTIDVMVDAVGTFNPQTGSATVSGTVTCSADADYAFIDVQLRHDVGRFIVSGSGSTDVWCDGTSQTWSAEHGQHHLEILTNVRV